MAVILGLLDRLATWFAGRSVFVAAHRDLHEYVTPVSFTMKDGRVWRTHLRFWR